MKLDEHALMQDARDRNSIGSLSIEDDVFLVLGTAQIIKSFASAPKQRMIGKLLQMRFN